MADDIEYRVLARKYRPADFSDLIGQEPMVRTLTNAFEMGRIAQAYMLTGVRGVGKTTTARILARALNHETEAGDGGPTVDLAAPGVHCKAIMEGRHPDVIEMDAASHTGIDDIREIIAGVRYRPTTARYKVYIVDEVHMLSKSAFNALLKTLEEPPPHVKFVFATTEIRKVPVTVLSRCQRFDLRRIEPSRMMRHLEDIAGRESVKTEEAALAMIARASEGSVRDALSLLDQAIAHAAGTGAGRVEASGVREMMGLADRGRVIDLFEHLMHGRTAEALAEVKAQYDDGAEPETILSDLAQFVHFVTRLRFAPEAADDTSLSPDERERGASFAATLSVRVLGRAWQMLLKGIAEVASSSHPLIAADMVIVRIAHAASLPTLDEALASLEEGAGGAAEPPASRTALMADAPKASASVQGTGAPASSVDRPQPAAVAVPTEENPPPVAMIAGTDGSSGATVALRVEPAPVVEPKADEDASRWLDERIDEAKTRRDLKFRRLLDAFVDPVRVSRGENGGRFEFRAADGAPVDLAQTIAAQLRETHGETWAVATVDQSGPGTPRERAGAAKKRLREEAEADPTVQAVLRTFPDARITDIRLGDDMETDALPDEPDVVLASGEADETEHESGDRNDPGPSGLDDYF